MEVKFPIDQLTEMLSSLSPKLDAKGANFIIDCPVCGHRECSISIDGAGHRWGCFRLKKCGERGNIFTLLKHLGTLSDYFSKRQQNNSSNYIDLSLLLPQASNSAESSLEEIEDLPTIKPPFGWKQVLKEDPYLDGRGFSSYKYCEVGRTILDPKLKNDYIVFLVRENHEIKGYVGRHVWDKKEIESYNDAYFQKHGIKNKIKRYSNAPGVDFSKLLYGYDEITTPKPVILVEGIFDKHAVDVKLGLQETRDLYTCGTFKASVSDHQIVKLLSKGITDIFLFYDPDVIRIIQRNVQTLSLFFNVKVILPTNNKDPDEMTQSELIDTIQYNVYTPQQILTDFLQVPNLK